jgi:hypothetical protein
MVSTPDFHKTLPMEIFLLVFVEPGFNAPLYCICQKDDFISLNFSPMDRVCKNLKTTDRGG